MFGKYYEENLRAVSSAKPSLWINSQSDITGDLNQLECYLYIDIEDNEYATDYFLLAHASAQASGYSVNGLPIWHISGISGAIKGFGEVIYSSLMIELGKQGAVLVSDRQAITADAEKIHLKLQASDNVQNNYLTATHPLHTNLETELDRNPDYPISHINTAYKLNPSKKVLSMHDVMMKSHDSRNLDEKKLAYLKEEGQYLAEWIIMNCDETDTYLSNGFKDLLPAKAVDCALSI